MPQGRRWIPAAIVLALCAIAGSQASAHALELPSPETLTGPSATDNVTSLGGTSTGAQLPSLPSLAEQPLPLPPVTRQQPAPALPVNPQLPAQSPAPAPQPAAPDQPPAGRGGVATAGGDSPAGVAARSRRSSDTSSHSLQGLRLGPARARAQGAEGGSPRRAIRRPRTSDAPPDRAPIQFGDPALQAFGLSRFGELGALPDYPSATGVLDSFRDGSPGSSGWAIQLLAVMSLIGLGGFFRVAAQRR